LWGEKYFLKYKKRHFLKEVESNITTSKCIKFKEKKHADRLCAEIIVQKLLQNTEEYPQRCPKISKKIHSIYKRIDVLSYFEHFFN